MAGERSSVENEAGGRRPARRSARRAAGWLVGALLAGALFGCEKASDDADAGKDDPAMVVVARVGDDVIRVDDLGGGLTPDNASRRVETLISRKLAATEARRRGYDTGEKLRPKLAEIRRMARQREEGLLRDALYNGLRTSLVFSEEELRAHYDKEANRFTQRQWKLRVQRFASEADARAVATALGPDGRLDPAKSESIGPLPVEKLPNELRQATDSLRKPGQRRLIGHANAFMLVELEEFVPAAQVSFEEAHDWVDRDLRATRGSDLLKAELERLRAEVKVTIDEKALADLTAPKAAPKTKAAAPAGSP